MRLSWCRTPLLSASIRTAAFGLAAAALIGAGPFPSAAEAQVARTFSERLLRWPERPAGAAEDGATEAEENSLVETDRNSFTFAPFTPGPGRLVFESAYSYIKFAGEPARHSLPETVLRYGVGERLELRFGYNLELGPGEAVNEGEVADDLGIDAEQQFQYGIKYALSRQRRDLPLLPNSAFLVQGQTPVASASGASQIRLGYVFGWIFPNGWTLDQSVRFGTDREGEDDFTVWSPSIVLRIPFDRERRLFTHLEYFGSMSADREMDFSTQLVDTGLHYLITPDFEVGTIVGFGINDQTRGVLVNVGFGLRF